MDCLHTQFTRELCSLVVQSGGGGGIIQVKYFPIICVILPILVFSHLKFSKTDFSPQDNQNLLAENESSHFL